jgi:hypothetical protein
METDNVWAKKRSAAYCSTKQNRMAFCHCHPPSIAAAAITNAIASSIDSAFASADTSDVAYELLQRSFKFIVVSLHYERL